MASEPLTKPIEREVIVRPQRTIPGEFIAPMQDKIGDLEAGPKKDKQEVVDNEIGHKGEGTNEEQVIDIDTRPVWEKMEDLANKYEMLEKNVAEYVDDQEVPKLEGPPQR